jgi:hypothetical protein
MAEVMGFGLSHYPRLAGVDEHMADILQTTLKDPDIPAAAKDPANWPAGMQAEWADLVASAQEHRHRLVENFQKLRAALDEFQPDAIVMWGDDQYENFREDVIPPFCIQSREQFVSTPWQKPVDDSATPRSMRGKPNAWGEGPDATFDVPGSPEIAKYLTSGLLDRDFDVCYSYQDLHYKGLTHAFLNAVLYLDYDRKGFHYPLIPFALNCYGRRVVRNKGGVVSYKKALDMTGFDPPSPSPRRCFDMGAAVARIAAESPWRIALVASSSWSHAFMVAKNYQLRPDTESDRKLYATLQSGDFRAWRDVPLESVEDAGQQEVLNWFPLAGAADELGWRPVYTDLVETEIFNSNKAFAILSA